MKRMFCLITLLWLILINCINIWGGPYGPEFIYHDCGYSEVVECENGNIIKSHILSFTSSWPAVVRKAYGINTIYSADKTITSVEIDDTCYEFSELKETECDFNRLAYISRPIVKIAEEVFKDCKELKKIAFKHDMVLIFGENSFENCNSLEGIRIPYSVSSSFCTNMRINPDNTYSESHEKYSTTICEYAFKNCTNLKYVIIDGMDTEIEENAFYGCPDVVIYCNSGSTAEEYAKANNIKYVLMDIEPSELEKAIFDYDMYSANNPGLLEASDYDFYNDSTLCSDYDLMLADWIQRGIAEGIQGSRVFDGQYYLAANQDLKSVYGEGYKEIYTHFLKYGCNELRKSSAEYCGKAYQNRYSDLAGLTGEELLKHYVTYGVAENRNARVEPVGGKYGDMDGDSVLSANDSAIILQKTLNNTFATDVDSMYGDVDGDGAITANDSVLVLQKVLNSSFALPVS